MEWTKEFHYVPQYKYTNTNQHGARYKKVSPKQIAAAKISCKCNDTRDMRNLILLSHILDTPVRYDFDSKPQIAYIRLVSREQLKKAEDC